MGATDAEDGAGVASLVHSGALGAAGTVVGDVPGQRLGAAVAVVDLTGDGLDDIVLGAPGEFLLKPSGRP